MQKASMKMNSVEDVNKETRFLGKLTPGTDVNKWGSDILKEDEQMRDFRIKAWEDENKKYREISQHTAEMVQDAWADMFFDAFTGKLKSLEDYFNAFYQSVARMASQYLSQQAVSGLMGMFGSGGGGWDKFMAGFESNTPIAAGGISHSGGVIGSSGGPVRSIPASYFSNAPRYHAGLFPDEQAAILQKGETVIPKGGSVGGDTYNIYQITATDTQSFVDACRRSGAVPMLAAEAINQNGGLRKTIMSRAK
jgi:hypothetical protein